MGHFSLKLMVIATLLIAGWSIGRAQPQRQTPDFELQLVIDREGTTLKCTRGCKLSIEANTPEGVTRTRWLPESEFKLKCPSSNNSCAAGSIGGWLVPSQ